MYILKFFPDCINLRCLHQDYFALALFQPSSPALSSVFSCAWSQGMAHYWILPGFFWMPWHPGNLPGPILVFSFLLAWLSPFSFTAQGLRALLSSSISVSHTPCHCHLCSLLHGALVELPSASEPGLSSQSLGPILFLPKPSLTSWDPADVMLSGFSPLQYRTPCPLLHI